MARVIVLDACVIIGFLESKDALHQKAVDLILEHAGEEFGASTVTLAEVLVGPTASGTAELAAAQKALKRLLRYEVEVSAGGAPHVARLRAITKLRLPDCFVLRAAEQSDGRVATFDTALAREARKLGFEVFGA